MYYRREVFVIAFLDISRAHWHAPATREIYIELPDELGLDRCWVGRLLKSMYGTRDAAHNFSLLMCTCMIALGFEEGKSNTCLFWNPQTMISCVIHGDDVTPMGPKPAIMLFIRDLGKMVLLKTGAI